MTIVEIDTNLLVLAKELMLEFDKQKTYDKFVCKHNYIGLLGEMIFDRYMRDNNVSCEWIPFVKKGCNQPDFILNNDKTIDIKTSYKDGLWFTQPKYDIYILCILNSNNSKINIYGYITKKEMIEAIKSGVAKQVPYKGRKDYVISAEDLKEFSIEGIVSK